MSYKPTNLPVTRGLYWHECQQCGARWVNTRGVEHCWHCHSREIERDTKVTVAEMVAMFDVCQVRPKTREEAVA